MAISMSDYVHLRGNLSVLKGIFPIIVLASLIGGCSNQTPLDSKSESVPYSSSGKGKAAYNRPYRVKGKIYYPLANAEGYRERGFASWYGAESGRRTAMGSRFRPSGLTAAHKTLPLPCKVKVTNLRNDRSVVVLVNDRGPFVRNRIIDLSKGAAKAIGMRGLAEVEVEYLEESAFNDY
jgi:rare lipoprotein A